MLRSYTIISIGFMALLAAANRIEAAPPCDVVIEGGRVIDPQTGYDRQSNICIAGGAIQAITAEKLQGRDVISAKGLTVAPGFIDLHAHGQVPIAQDFQARDGVTTALDMEIGAYPIAPFYEERRGRSRINYGASVSHYAIRVMVKTGIAVGHIPTNIEAAQRIDPLQSSWADASLSTAELARALALYRQGTREGGLGLGLGIEYLPGADQSEILEFFKEAARQHAPVFVHTRSARSANAGDLLSIAQEVVADAATTGASLHLVHVTSKGLSATPAILDLIRGARAHGVDVTTEAYPYAAGCTTIGSALFNDGWQQRWNAGYADVEWVQTGERLSEASFHRYRAQVPEGTVIFHMIPEPMVRLAMKDPIVMIASDGGPFTAGRDHPRSAGTFSRVLGKYVREQGDLTLVEALRKMTIMPAQRLEGFVPAMRKKGRLQVGADADITIFDPATIIDRATYASPAQPSLGIVHVLVAGTPVVRDGLLQSKLFPGRGVRNDRGGAEPAAASSPMGRANDALPLKSSGCDADNGGIKLPPGFCATVFADEVGRARHLTVSESGTVYINTLRARSSGSEKTAGDGFLVALRDTNGDGRADLNTRFGDGAGGTGVVFHDKALYAEAGDRIVRYALPAGIEVPSAAPEVIVSGLPATGDHPMHSFAIDRTGNLYVAIGSATNSCQVQNRMLRSAGVTPCTELDTRAGIWRYDANRVGQQFSKAERYATGIRNVGGLAFDSAGELYATQHGRDQLGENWPQLYRPEQSAELPAEELLRVQAGADYGWPKCYFDGVQQKRVLAPEYGGDGGKAVGICSQKRAPIASFPAHWAPNALLFYDGQQFPDAYRAGAFIAFHGSWNRAPFPQGGYNVVFQPFADGKPSGRYTVFADGFAGAVKDPGEAAHRPSGLALGPDGALYIADDMRGRIWRVTFQGGSKTADNAAEATFGPDASNIKVPRDEPASLPIPPNGTAAELSRGERVFRSQTCTGCHGLNAKGTPLAPGLTSGKWLWSDGSLAAIKQIIAAGVPRPKADYRSPMPPMGGAQLSNADLEAVAAYVWALGHRNLH